MTVGELLGILNKHPIPDMKIMVEYKIKIGDEIITKRTEVKEIAMNLTEGITIIK